jgi:hypothetical protein
VNFDPNRLRLEKLGEIVALKRGLAEAERERDEAEGRVQVLRKQLADANNEFALIAGGQVQQHGKNLDDLDAERPYAGLGGRSIVETIMQFFWAHPDAAFSPQDLMLYCVIPAAHVEGVRAAFKRLVARGQLEHLDHAEYRLHPEQRELVKNSN